MDLRIKVISPIKVDEADLERRQVRYSQRAGPNTSIAVFNLEDGPTALNTPGDMLYCEYAVFREGAKTSSEEFDAILIDCVFDPAVDALAEHTGLPTFGPMRTTLPLVPLVSPNFGIVARAEKQCEMLADLVVRYGFGDYLISTRALGITYPESRKPEVFTEAMCRQLGRVTQKDGARAVVMGSTTMALGSEIVDAAGNAPLFLPGMVTLRVMESLWSEGLLRQPAVSVSGAAFPDR